MEIFLQDSAATEALGRLLGKHASSGDVFCLSGDLGAGKTLLSRGVAVALGAAAEDVNSPTFAIMNVYQGRELEISILIYIASIVPKSWRTSALANMPEAMA